MVWGMRKWFPWAVAVIGLLVMALSYTQGYGLGVWVDEHQADGIDFAPLFGLALTGLVLFLGGVVVALTDAAAHRAAALVRQKG